MFVCDVGNKELKKKKKSDGSDSPQTCGAVGNLVEAMDFLQDRLRTFEYEIPSLQYSSQAWRLDWPFNITYKVNFTNKDKPNISTRH